jgi:hypothetical protein
MRVPSRKVLVYSSVAVLLTGWLVTRTFKGQAAYSPEQEQFAAGIGTVPIAASVSQVTQSVRSLSTFVSERSGIWITQSAQDKLAELEAKTLSGDLHRLSVSQVSQALSDTLHERLASVTNPQIEDMAANSFRVSPDARALSNWSPHVQIRSTGENVRDATTFITKAEQYRDASTVEAVGYRSLVPGLVQERMQVSLDRLHAMLPSQFSADSLSPVQAYVVAYGFVTDEPLSHSLSSLNNAMSAIAAYFQTTYGLPDSSPGRKPYGDKGYLYASPVGIFWDEAAVTNFIVKLEQGGQQ